MAAVLHPGLSQIPLRTTETLVTPAGAHEGVNLLDLVTCGSFLGSAAGE